MREFKADDTRSEAERTITTFLRQPEVYEAIRTGMECASAQEIIDHGPLNSNARNAPMDDNEYMYCDCCGCRLKERWGKCDACQRRALLPKGLPHHPVCSLIHNRSITRTVAMCGSGRVDWAHSAQRDAQQWVRAAEKYIRALEEALIEALATSSQDQWEKKPPEADEAS